MAGAWRLDSVPRLLLFGLALAVAVTIVYGGLTSTTAFGTYNTAWDGVSELRDLASEADREATIVRNTSAYESAEPGESVGFVLSPDSRYSDAEVARVERFVRRGGTLVVAEDIGTHANPLLARVGAEARFSNSSLRDERHYGNSPAMPVARNPSDDELARGVDALALNHGTVLEPRNATVVVNTSSFAYLDRNDNSELDRQETLQEYPVVTRERVGDGTVVAVADPSLFINAMLDREDNRAFAANLVSDRRVSLFDVSHLTALPPLVAAQFALQESPIAQVSLGLLIVVAVTYAGVFSMGWDRFRTRQGGEELPSDPPSTDAVEAWVQSRHPEWDADRVRRVSEEITPPNRTSQQND